MFLCCYVPIPMLTLPFIVADAATERPPSNKTATASLGEARDIEFPASLDDLLAPALPEAVIDPRSEPKESRLRAQHTNVGESIADTTPSIPASDPSDCSNSPSNVHVPSAALTAESATHHAG